VTEAGKETTRVEGSYKGIPIIKDLRNSVVLFSWTGPDGSFRFALVPDKREPVHRFLDNFDRNRAAKSGIQALERELSKLPAKSLVTWMKDEPNKIDYPKKDAVRRISALAVRLRLDLQFNETRYEQPGV
jgi:hypothetical protein